MKQFKIRCSAISDIMAEPRLKSETLSQGAKTYVEKWVKQNMFGRREQINSKYISKGLETEEQGLNLITQVLKLGFFTKNEERKEDDYKTGEIDFVEKGVIYDNKASFSIETFPLFGKSLDVKYYAQMQGYLDLWGLEKGKVCYTLVNTPFDILKRELRWIEDDNEKQQAALNHIFTEKYWKEVRAELFPNAKPIKFQSIEDKYRVKVFEVVRDDEYINKINIKSKICNEYAQELLVNL